MDGTRKVVAMECKWNNVALECKLPLIHQVKLLGLVCWFRTNIQSRIDLWIAFKDPKSIKQDTFTSN